MQLRAAAVLACTVWLVMVVGEEAASLPPLDQYSPPPPNHPQVAQDQKDQGPLRIPFPTRQEHVFVDKRFSHSVRTQSKSFSTATKQNYSDASKFFDNDRPKDLSKVDGHDETEIRKLENESKERRDEGVMNFPFKKVAYDDGTLSEFLDDGSREVFPKDSDFEVNDNYDEKTIPMLNADDNFEDQGPGSVEVYKLDLYKDKAILSPEPPMKTYMRSKSKTPKKAFSGDVNWKSKNNEELKVVHPRVDMMSNYLNELVSKSSRDQVFGVGGVPELQVGCEGLEASHIQKRSFDFKSDAQNGEVHEPISSQTPLSIDLDDYSDEMEMGDAMLEMLKPPTTTKRPLNKRTRGDMAPSDEINPRRRERLPTRGDIGQSLSSNSTQLANVPSPNTYNPQLQNNQESRHERNVSPVDGLEPASNSLRKLLSIEDLDSYNFSSSLEEFQSNQLPDIRRKREDTWGYGEDEGIDPHEELITEEKRRRDEETRRRGEYMRRQEEIRRRNEYTRKPHRQPSNSVRSNFPISHVDHRTDSELYRNRRDYEKRLQEQNRRNQREHERLENGRRQNERIAESNSRNESSNSIRPVYSRSQEFERRQQEQRRRQEEEQWKQEYERKMNDYIRTQTEYDRMEELTRKQEEERKLQDYIRRNQPVNVPRRIGTESRSQTNRGDRDYDTEERNRIMDESRRFEEARRGLQQSRPIPPSGGRPGHGPSPPVDARQQTASGRTERRQELERLEEERIRFESRRYEEDRRRQYAAGQEEERRRIQNARQEASRSEQERQRQVARQFEEERRRQQASLSPANLMVDQQNRRMEDARREQERMRSDDLRRAQENQRRRQEHEMRLQEERRRALLAANLEQQRMDQETARLNRLPVSARIIIDEGGAGNQIPHIGPRFREDEIGFQGINPSRPGHQAAPTPAAPTARPPVLGPRPCIWAIVKCCPISNTRTRKQLGSCFASMGCPGANWDPNPCRTTVIQAAQKEVMDFYKASEKEY